MTYRGYYKDEDYMVVCDADSVAEAEEFFYSQVNRNSGDFWYCEEMEDFDE